MTSCLLVSAPFSGIEVHFRLLADALAESGRVDDVRTIWLKHEPDELLSRVPPLGWNWYTSAAWSTLRQFRELCKAGAPLDVAVLNQVNPALMQLPFTGFPPILLQLDTTPMITSSMAPHYLGRPPRPPAVEAAKRMVYRTTFRSLPRIVAVSQLVKGSLVNDYEVDADAVTVIPFSIDTDFFTRDPSVERRQDPPRIVFVGGEFFRKGGDLVLDVARRPRFRQYAFDVVTTSEVGDLPDNVVVHRGVGAKTDRLRQLLAEASMFVLPTYADVSSIASMEAMSMGLPVVTTAVGGVPEVVADGETGYLVEPGDVDAFAERLGALVDSTELRSQMGAAGRQKAVSEFGMATNVNTYLDLIDEIVGGR